MAALTDDGVGWRRRGSVALRVYRLLCRLLYSRFAWAYDAVAWGVSAGEWAEWRRSAAAHVRGESVVDLACGTGGLAAQMAKERRLVVGVDRSPQMLAQAARRKQTEGAHTLRLVQASAEALPFATGSVTTVTATFPAEYVLEAAVHRECARVLKRGTGRLVIGGLWVEANESILRLIPVFYGRPNPGAVTALANALGEVGFSVCVVTQDLPSAHVGMIVAERES